MDEPLETRTALCALDVIDEIYPDARALTDFIRRWSNTLFDCWQRDRTPRPAPQVPDPVNQDELWQRYGICKALAFALWQTRQCRGQQWKMKLRLSRDDVEAYIASRRTA